MGGELDEKGLGVKIGEARRASGLTQQALCQKSGLSYSTLAKIERGAIKSPSVFTIFRIAEVLETSLDGLLGVSSSKPPKPAKKRSRSGIEFVYFDINGCLVHFYHRAFASIAEATGVSPEIVETSFWHYNDLVCRGDMTLDDFNGILAEKFKVKKFDWASYYLDAVEPIPETVEMAKWAIKHYRIGLISNIMPGLIKAMTEREQLPNLDYDVIIDSSETGFIKPEPDIYDLAVKRAGVNPGEILLIDDSRANLMAAGKKGWMTIWFDDYRPKEAVEKIKSALEF